MTMEHNAINSANDAKSVANRLPRAANDAASGANNTRESGVKSRTNGRKSGVKSGMKYRAANGVSAIKDGVKARRIIAVSTPAPKPPWLRVRVGGDGRYAKVRRAVRDNELATVCEESRCPNIGECWGNGTATLMLMGSVCTRACRFCAVDTGNPNGYLDDREPANAARSVALMNLRYVVLTSVDRDDLADGGAAHYAACVRAIKARCPATRVEALTPDFRGDRQAVATVVAAGVDVFAQNLETVRRLTHPLRDPRAGYEQTLAVLAHAHALGALTKSSLMLGLGETVAEVGQAMADLRASGVRLLTLGQYLQPTRHHAPVARWVPPEEFQSLRRQALRLGFRDVAAGPLVRSSYRADLLAGSCSE